MTEEPVHLPAVLEILSTHKLITADETEALQDVDMATSGLRIWTDANRIGASCALAHAKPDVLAICARNGLVGLVYAEVDQRLKDVLPVSFAFHVTPEILNQYKQESPAAANVAAADFGELPPGVAVVLATVLKNQEVQQQQFTSLATMVERVAHEKDTAGQKLLAAMTEATVNQFEHWTQTNKPHDPAKSLTEAGDQLVKTMAAVGEVQKQFTAAAPTPAAVPDSDIATARAVLGDILGPGGKNIYTVLHALKNGIPLSTADGAGVKPTKEQMAAAGVETDQANDQGDDSTEDIFRSQVKVRAVPQGETA